MVPRLNRCVDPTDVVTAEEAAARRNTSVPTIWRRAARGELHPIRYFGRTVFPLKEVDALTIGPAGRFRSPHNNSPKNERRPGQGTAPRGGGDADADPSR